MNEDRVAQTFVGRAIFITGGSGFLGKVLIEKLLRVCPDIKKIFLLMRTKKGKDPKQRLLDIFSNPLFDGLKETHGLEMLMDKCQVIGGDVTLADLGISSEDRQTLIDEVSIIYHCAATIRFDETLKKAILLNTRGTKLMIQLAKDCKHLAMFCHVSTAYCHLHEKHLLEKSYDPPANPHKVINCVEWLDESVVDAMTDKILGNLPNTYAFTKALGEGLVVETMDDLPSVILRPSIVIPIYQDPLPGWTDNINGPTGLLIGAGKGVIRTMYCDSDGYGDYLPVDIAVNCMLLATWNFIENNDRSRRIYNVTSSAEIKVSWNQVIEMGREIVTTKVPLNGVLWYPGGSMKNNRLYHNFCMIFYHFVPAIFLDALLFCLGYKPILIRVHKRILKGFQVFEYYANNQWDFDNSNVQYLRTVINKKEKELYKIDAEDLDMMAYFENCIKAARIYILNEAEDTLPAARRHMRIMWWVDKICKHIIMGICLYYVALYFYNVIFDDETPQDLLQKAIET
ncbi:putative fatty acyl-CoA reductase CG5065 [Phlebotomus argentipes]|uniref:putative fatty acyl-CoA reductase CG5065 n=1 Tax=Phlebotomus argentipes TaxID=94469 RepID=UPI0028930F7F|nr:putative fatty acyl-CoA reductase CG5065 [Phlebotomus argentipes]